MPKQPVSEPLLPGMKDVLDKEKRERAEQTYQDLLARFKRPQTRASAEWFLRNLERDKDVAYCVDWTVKPRKGYDFHRIVLKTADASEADIKWEMKFKLDLDDEAEYDHQLIAAAQATYDRWLEYERPKYE